MDAGKILYANDEGRLVLKLVGDLRLGHSFDATAALDAFLDQQFEEHRITCIVIDIRGVESIDSTNLGLLAKASSYTQRNLKNKPVLVSTHPDINTILRSVGFDQVFHLVDHVEDPPPALEALKIEGDTEKDFPYLILEAHRALAALNDKNAAEFKELIEIFEKELE
jgi:anti-anti-sigma factor